MHRTTRKHTERAIRQSNHPATHQLLPLTQSIQPNPTQPILTQPFNPTQPDPSHTLCWVASGPNPTHPPIHPPTLTSDSVRDGETHRYSHHPHRLSRSLPERAFANARHPHHRHRHHPLLVPHPLPSHHLLELLPHRHRRLRHHHHRHPHQGPSSDQVH